MIGHLVDLVVLVGAAVMAFLAFRLGSSKPREVSTGARVSEKMRANTLEGSTRQHDEILEAIDAIDAAKRLADLGNRRRK